MISRVYGHGEGLYRTKIELFGGFRIHIFHRPDEDMAWHDHPSDLHRFPFKGYYEEILDLVTDEIKIRWVKPWRWSVLDRRDAHRIRNFKGKMLVTLCWIGPDIRRWGFWHFPVKGRPSVWVYWQDWVKRGRHEA